MTLCTVCPREARGYWFLPWVAGLPGTDAAACSMRCLEIATRSLGMVDPTPNEEDALEAASAMAGEFLEGIGKTDLAALERKEWEGLIEAVVTGYCDRLRELCEQDKSRVAGFTNTDRVPA